MNENKSFQGKIINWNDDKGFGFVEPNGGGERAFVHIKAFRPRAHRPVNGELIIYQLVRGKDNRYKAENIKFAHAAKKLDKRHHQSEQSKIPTVFVLLFCVGLSLTVLIGKLSAIILGLYIVMSIIAFIAYAMDKSAAQQGRWRTKESTLHMIGLLGGWPGALFAQNKLRHKSSKTEFKIVYWITVFVNIAGLSWLCTPDGEVVLNNIIRQFLL
ncbi:DUF1294 domain-containing protein [Psychromonas sp. PT13]|uniref:DUF1294 domain-containing protein n=1 Tax=Psychromonas sp. PT13 TaxID=3439547 RepID=UPI003EBE8E7E